MSTQVTGTELRRLKSEPRRFAVAMMCEGYDVTQLTQKPAIACWRAQLSGRTTLDHRGEARIERLSVELPRGTHS